MRYSEKVTPGALDAYTVPVVFHIIHKGRRSASVQTCRMPSCASQIAVLNPRLIDAEQGCLFNLTEFSSVAGSITINFVLAQTGSNGNAQRQDCYVLKGLEESMVDR